VETPGRTVEEAKDAALDQLGVSEDDAEFEVLEEARSGLFGRLRNEARVRARVRPATPRPKDDRRRRRGRREREEGSADGADKAPRPPRDRERAKAASQSPAAREEGPQMTEEPSLDEQGEVAESFVAGLVERLGLGDVQVGRRKVDDETVEVLIDGEPTRLGVLIGPRAGTLSAIQELARTVVQRRTGARQGKIVIDVSGYRERRRAALEAFTRRVAEDVLATGVKKALEPMNPADRKVVHDTVNDISGVSTSSEGEHAERRVVIVPDRAPTT
jgi:spoIIIJ-associated protein